MSKAPLELLKEIEWKQPTRPNGVCPYCAHTAEHGHSDTCNFGKAISILEAQPEPGEFTKEFRYLLRVGNGAGDSTNEAVYEYAETACDLIDAQAEKIKSLEAENKILISKCNERNVRLKSEREECEKSTRCLCETIDRLTAENKELKEIIDSKPTPDANGFWGKIAGRLYRNNKSQQAEIEAAKERYDQLHIDFCNRGAEIERLERDLETSNLAIQEFAKANLLLQKERDQALQGERP